MAATKAIKIGLIRAGVSQVDIARALGVARTSVCAVVAGRGRSARIEQAIARAIGQDAHKLFGPSKRSKRAGR